MKGLPQNVLLNFRLEFPKSDLTIYLPSGISEIFRQMVSTPVQASKKKNESTVYFNLYGDMKQLSSKPKFKIGDKVRISKYKRKVFDEGYTPNWTEKILFPGR